MRLFLALLMMIFLVSCDTYKEHEGATSGTNLVNGYFRLSNTALSGQSIVLEYRYVNATTIEFRASLPLSHSEWFGLGLDSDSTMPDADNKIVFWNDASQSAHTSSDRFSVARSTPRIDAEENIVSSNLTLSSGLTVWTVQFPLSNDSNQEDFLLTPGNTMFIHVAKGLRSGDALSQHQFKTAFQHRLELND